MGGCLSKKTTNSTSSGAIRRSPPEQTKSTVQVEKKKVEEHTVKREVFIIKHRKSQDIERKPNEEKGESKKVIEIAESCPTLACNNASNGGLGLANGNGIFVATPIRTSSCTKEEVDAILIQCGRLSRSSSTRKLRPSSGSGENNGSIQKGKNFSGSKRSYDFDNENGNEDRNADRKQGGDFEENPDGDDDIEVVGEGSDRHRQRQRQSRMVSSPSKGRRRTPSRERDLGQRSGSRERSSGNGGRRVSRSPGKRSESPTASSNGVSGANLSASNANSSTNGRPGKMVSVPATVSSLAMDKSNNAKRNETISTAAIKRIQVKRNAGSEAATAGARTAASPRARSPARTSVKIFGDSQNGSSNQDQQQHVSLSRSNSRKAEVSPCRRNPLGEIDNNVPVDQIPVQALKAPSNILRQAPIQKESVDHSINRSIAEKNVKNITCIANKQQQSSVGEETRGPQAMCSNVVVNMVASGNDCFKPQALTRTRSSRLSRDLDICAEDFSDPAPSSYAALLLEDIQNFHQKSNLTYTLPACLSKARSIVEAVADLNSGTRSNFSYDKQGKPTAEELNRCNGSLGFDPLAAGKKGLEGKGPFMQSEVAATDDLMAPTYQKYVTVRRGSLGEEDIEEQESSSSNSFVGGQQHWVSSSSLEPDSAESTGHWTSSRSCSREDNRMPLGSQRQAISEPGNDSEDALRRFSGNRRESDRQQSGIGRGRLGSR